MAGTCIGACDIFCLVHIFLSRLCILELCEEVLIPFIACLDHCRNNMAHLGYKDIVVNRQQKSDPILAIGLVLNTPLLRISII